MRVLVTGGAGYIGSHTCKALALAGHEPIVIDNLCTGNRAAVKWGRFHLMDVRDREALQKLYGSLEPEAILHFAASAYVGDSMRAPLAYYDNNVAGALSVLDAAVHAGASFFVLSSSCAIYGIPSHLPITESTQQQPVNPYGDTKLACERMAQWVGMAHGLKWAALRYFNAAGADPDGEIGERHTPETHVIPLALKAAAGSTPPLTVFGADYDTPDGTAIRDFVHVADLAEAHVRALENLATGGSSRAFNLGSGVPISVRSLLSVVEEVTGREVPHGFGLRRDGDPPALWADASAAAEALRWTPVHSDIREIIPSAWNWERRQTGGEAWQ